MLGIFGDITNPYVPGYQTGPGGLYGLTLFLSNLIKTVTVVAGIFALWNLLAAGLKYISSSGDPKAAMEANQNITNSVIGVVIIIASFAITKVVQTIFGIDILNPSIYGPI